MKLRDVIVESNQSIVNLGIPKCLAKLFTKHFGKNAFTVATWFDQTYGISKSKSLYQSLYRYKKLITYIDFVESLDSEQKYIEVSKEYGMSPDGFHDDRHRELLKKELEEELFNTSFFTYNEIISDLINGKLTDIRAYKNKTISEAEEIYSEKKIFHNKKPYKTYKTGFKWYDVGRKSSFIAKEMNNCGSVGVMGCDPDRTMFVLFDDNNKSRAMVVYSPNEKKLSSLEGAASSHIKPEYADYVVDLADNLNATFSRYDNQRGVAANLKYIYGSRLTSIVKLKPTDKFQRDHLMEIVLDGKTYFTDGDELINKNDFEKYVKDHSQEKSDMIDLLSTLFSSRKKEITVINIPHRRENV